VRASLLRQVSLNDMYKGKTSKLALSKQVLCPTCNGVGGKKGAAKCVTLGPLGGAPRPPPPLGR
jgi:DnaJ homolog subfamily A member 2